MQSFSNIAGPRFSLSSPTMYCRAAFVAAAPLVASSSVFTCGARPVCRERVAPVRTARVAPPAIVRAAPAMQIVDEAKLLDIRSKEVFMPALSSTMTEGVVVAWLKQPGERVEVGEMIMTVESDKADMDGKLIVLLGLACLKLYWAATRKSFPY